MSAMASEMIFAYGCSFVVALAADARDTELHTGSTEPHTTTSAATALRRNARIAVMSVLGKDSVERIERRREVPRPADRATEVGQAVMEAAANRAEHPGEHLGEAARVGTERNEGVEVVVRTGSLGEDARLGSGHQAIGSFAGFGSVIGEGRNRRTRAHQVAVAVGAVDAAHWRPVLVADCRPSRESTLFAGIATIPVVHGDVRRGMRRVAQRAVFDRPLPRFDGADLVAYRHHRIA